MPFRLAPDQMRRLERAAHSLRKTKQSFVQEVVLERVAEIEEGKKIKKLPPITDGTQKRENDDGHGGLGLTSIIKQRQQHRQEVAEVSPPPQQAPVVVQVGNTTTPTTGSASLTDLDRLAIYVVKGDEFMRDARKRTAIDVLRASAATDEELKVLVARLEEIVAVKTKTAEENSGLGKIARVAFDKLATLLQGE